MRSISVICATIDDVEMVGASIASIRNAALYAGVAIEIIIVDQSVKAECLVLESRTNFCDVVVIHSLIRGTSVCRNIGLEQAKSDWLMFWDADCLMDVNFFLALDKLIESHQNADLFFGRIRSPDLSRDVLRKWPKSTCFVSQFHRWRLATCVNGVWRNRSSNRTARLDERFGIGARYGSCEDVDFFLRIRGMAVYSPNLIVYHPEQKLCDVPIGKALSYSFGFGALCRKHLWRFGATYLFLTIGKKIYEVVFGKISFSTAVTVNVARIRGFLYFR